MSTYVVISFSSFLPYSVPSIVLVHLKTNIPCYVSPPQSSINNLPSNAGDVGSIPGQGSKIPYAVHDN